MSTNKTIHHLHWFISCLSLLAFLSTTLTNANQSTVEILDPTLPPLPQNQPPKCSIIALTQEFRGSIIRSVPANYSNPIRCPPPWTMVTLELSMSARNANKSSIASVFLNGGEILRTASPITRASLASWTVHKDITRYSALLRGPRQYESTSTLAMVMEGINIGAVFTANITFHFYRGGFSVGLGSSSRPSIKGLYRHPANYIVPITKSTDSWFRVEANSSTKKAVPPIPRNTYRAILEIFVSYHGDEELWYTKPLSSGHLNASNANGGFRQVYAEIDGKFVGGHIVFPVIYPGSINPYLWSPVTAIGTFDMPSYNLELTPLLQLLLDGKHHQFSLGVKDSQKFWLLSANLHLWVDRWSEKVQARIVDYKAPPLELSKEAAWQHGDGTSLVEGEGRLRFVGWVKSSRGNITVSVRQKVTFKSQVQVQNGGAVRQIDVVNRERFVVGVHRGSEILGRVQVFSDAPMQVQTSISPAAGGSMYENSRLYHQLEETVNVNHGDSVVSSFLSDRQDGEGAMLVHEGVGIWGSGSSKSLYKFRDDATCYLRSVDVDMGEVKADIASRSCAGERVADA